MTKVQIKYKSLKQLREEYPEIAMEYSRNLKQVQGLKDSDSYQNLYNTVLKLEEFISPIDKAKLLSPLVDVARTGDVIALDVVNLQSNDTKFEAELQEYVEKIGDCIIGKDSFSPGDFQSKYRALVENIKAAADENSKRVALFEITGLLHKAYRTNGIDDEFRDLLFKQREIFENRISYHDAVVKLGNIREGIIQSSINILEELDGIEDFVCDDILELQNSVN